MTSNKAVTSSDDSLRRFVLWALATLKLRVSGDSRHGYTLEVPEPHRAFFGGAQSVGLAFADAGEGDQPGRRRVSFDAPLFRWTVDQLAAAGDVLHAVPLRQPVGVHQLSATLFEAYTVDGGSIHLGGCTLEDRPLLRLTFLEAATAERPPQLVHFFTAADGQVVSAELQRELQLSDLTPLAGAPPRLEGERLEGERLDRWVSAARQRYQQDLGGRTAELLATTVVWCKFAAGKISFVIGDATADVSFAEWAQRLVAKDVLPPPLRCAETGQQSYHVAATSDGRISVSEAIRACDASGRRVLVSDLQTCQTTGRAVLPEFISTCPVTGQQVVTTVMQPCSMCGQQVSPRTLEEGRCGACREMTRVRKDDPRLARVLGAYPRLDRWNRWRIAETSSVYVLAAAAFVKRLLVVVNKESLELLRLATRNRFSQQWLDAPEADRHELLRRRG